MTDRMQTVQGRCPACGWTSLFLGDGGHVTCSRLECPNPTAADDLLHGEHVGAATPLVCSDERHAAKVADLERQLAHAREECRTWAEAESADIAAGSYAGRVEELEAAIARIRAYADDAIAAGDTGPGVHIGQLLLHLLDQPTPDVAATQATGFVPYTPPHITKAGNPADALVVEPYRNDRGENAWVFRCWGTDTCDGWLSLDHTTQQSAERARDRHVAEEHQEQPHA